MDLYTEKTALITGASTGIGAAFATRLAAAGTHLILVARSEEKLRALASQLADQHAIRAEVIVADLSRVGTARTVFQETQKRGLTVDILINNAGFGTYGQFETLDAEREQQEILLNVASLVDLTHHFVPSMVERSQGAIINVASLAAFQPTPYMAVYGATKAFVLSFSQALWGEFRDKGVRIVALCPGETATVTPPEPSQAGRLAVTAGPHSHRSRLPRRAPPRPTEQCRADRNTSFFRRKTFLTQNIAATRILAEPPSAVNLALRGSVPLVVMLAEEIIVRRERSEMISHQ